MDIKIRPATTGDLKEMQTLFVETIKSSCSDDYNQEQMDAWASSVDNTDRWGKILTDQYCIIAESGNMIVGFGSLDNGRYIDLMYVHKDYLRQGIADTIYQELNKESKRMGYLKMTSDVSKTARPFFEKKGFEVVKENIIDINGIEIINFKMSQ